MIPWWTGAAVLTAWSLGIVVVVVLGSPVGGGAAAIVVLLVWVVAIVVRRSLVMPAALCAVTLFLGLWRAGLSPPASLPSGMAGQAVTVAGQVAEDPVQPRHGLRLVVSDPVRHLRVLATVYGSRSIHYGDLVLLTGRLEPPPRFEAFDYAAYLADHGISGILQSPRLVQVVPHPGDPLHSAIFAMRHALVAGIDRALPEPQAALLLGVVFGYRQALPRPLEQAMIACGLIVTVFVHTAVRW